MSRGSRRLALLLLLALTAAAVPVAVVSFLSGCRCNSLRL